MKDRQPSTGTPLGIPEDRLHEGRTSLPLVPLSEYQRTDYKYEGQAFPWHPSRSTRGQTTSTTTSLPLVPLSEHQRTDYMKDRQDTPGVPSGDARGQTTCRTDKASPGVPFSGCQRTDYMYDRQSLHLVYPSRDARGQTTCTTDKASTWCTLLGMPEDRLHVRQTKPPPGVPFSGCQRTDYMYDRQSLHLVYPSRDARGQTTCTTDKASTWCTLLGMPEDRLHVGQTKPPPGVPFSGCQRTDYM